MTKTSMPAVPQLALCLTLLYLPLSALTQNTKFHKVTDLKIGPGCGTGLDQNSSPGSCLPFMSRSNVQHVCVALPQGMTDKNVLVRPYAADTSGYPFLPCGDGIQQNAACGIQWSRFETTEFYPDTNRICGRFKNWSNDREIIIRIDVTEK
jgi:hypothetical protein